MLIDTSDQGQQQYLQNIKTVLDEQNVNIQEIVLTHWHHDHVGAVKELCSLLKGKIQSPNPKM